MLLSFPHVVGLFFLMFVSIPVQASLIDALPPSDGFEGQVPTSAWFVHQGTLQRDSTVFVNGATSMKWTFQPNGYVVWRPEVLADMSPESIAAKMSAGQPYQLGFMLSIYLRREHPFVPQGDPQKPRILLSFHHKGALVQEKEYDLHLEGWNRISDSVESLLKDKKGAAIDEIRLHPLTNARDATVWIDEAVCAMANPDMGVVFPAQQARQTLPKGTRQSFDEHDAGKNWKPGTGSRMKIHEERSLATKKCLEWSFADGSTISFHPPIDTIVCQGNGDPVKALPIGLFYHVAKPFPGRLVMEHLQKGKVVKSAWTFLNAAGWNSFYSRAPQVPYDEIRLVAPKEARSGVILIDEFEHNMDMASSIGPHLNNLLMPDFVSDSNAVHKFEDYPATDLDDYAINPRQPLRNPSEIGMPTLPETRRKLTGKEIEIMRSTIPQAAPPWRNAANEGQLNDLRAAYRAMDFRISGGQVSGRPIRPMDGDRMAHWGAININQYLGYLHQLIFVYQSPLPQPIKDEFRSYVMHSLEHLKHQPIKFCAPGWNGNYTTRNWIRAAVDLRPVLFETGHLDWYLELLLAQHDLRVRMWTDPVYSDMDFLKNIIPKWAQAISLMEPGPLRWQRTHALRVFCERAYGTISGGIPMAGGTMHHGCHHLSYGLGALGSLQELIRMLQNLGVPMDTSKINSRYFNTMRLLLLSTCGNLSPPNTDANNASAFGIDSFNLLLEGLRPRDEKGGYLMPQEMQSWAMHLIAERLATDQTAEKKMDGHLKAVLKEHLAHLTASGLSPRPISGSHIAPVISLVAHHRVTWMATMASYPFNVTALETRYANAKYARLMKSGSCFITYPDTRGDGGMGTDGWQWNLVPGTTMALQPDWSLNRIGFHKESHNHTFASGGAQVNGRAIWGWVDPKGARHSSFASATHITRLVTGIDRLKEEGRPILSTLFQVSQKQGPGAPILLGDPVSSASVELEAKPAVWLVDPLRTGYLIHDGGTASLRLTRGQQSWNFIANHYLKTPWNPNKDPNYDQTAANVFDAHQAEELRPLFHQRIGDFTTAVLDHGNSPSRLLYSIHPDTTLEMMKAAATEIASPDRQPMVILHESDRVHAYHERGTGAFAYAMFDDHLDFTTTDRAASPVVHPLLSCEKGCFLFAQPEGEILHLNLIRTDNKFTGPLRLRLKGAWKIRRAEVYGKPQAATAASDGDSTRIEIPYHGYSGECAASDVWLIAK